MAIERVVAKYEPVSNDDYIGGVGQLWVDLDTGYLHLSDGMNGGGNTVVTTDNSGALNLTALQLPDGTEVGASFVHFPNGQDASVGIVGGAGLTFKNNDLSIHATKSIVIDTAGGQFLAQENGGSGPYGGFSFVADGGHDTGMYSAGDGNLQFYNNAAKTLELFPPANGHADAVCYGTFTLTPLNYVPTGRPGMMAMCDGSSGWNGGGDGLQHLMIYTNGAWHKVY